MRKRTKILASVLIGLVSACNTSFASSYTNAVSGVLTSYNARLETTAIYKPNDYLELSKCYSDCKDELSKLKATNELEFKFNELLLEYSNARLKMFEAKSKGVDDKQLKIECDAINKEITKLYEMMFRGGIKMGVPMEGIITDKLKGGSFIVQNEDGILSATCKPCGKMTMNKITLTVGDRVKVELSEYDLTRGRIMYRL